jgi:hypothetical protein
MKSDPRDLAVIMSALDVYAPSPEPSRTSVRTPRVSDPEGLFNDGDIDVSDDDIVATPVRPQAAGRRFSAWTPLVLALTAVVYVVGTLIGALVYVGIFRKLFKG